MYFIIAILYTQYYFSLSHTHTDENPAIVIPSSDLQAQAAALGSPVDTLINDPTFIGTAPEGVAGSGGALTVTVSLLLVSVVAALGMMN